MEKIKVFISDPQVLFREGIHFILSGEDDFEVIGETTNNEEAYRLIQVNPPNIAILSMRNGKYNGPQITRRIRRSLPSVSVILISEGSDEEQLFAATKSGASACLTKDTDPDLLLDVIRVVAQGSLPIIEDLLIPGIASRTLAEFEAVATLNEQLDNLLAILTPKDTEILNCIAAGNNLEQVTTKLEMNEETIRRNLRLIFNKLVANDHARGIIEAAQQSLPSIIRSGINIDDISKEYVTKAEFAEFKENLLERLKSLIGEIS